MKPLFIRFSPQNRVRKLIFCLLWLLPVFSVQILLTDLYWMADLFPVDRGSMLIGAFALSWLELFLFTILIGLGKYYFVDKAKFKILGLTFILFISLILLLYLMCLSASIYLFVLKGVYLDIDILKVVFSDALLFLKHFTSHEYLLLFLLTSFAIVLTALITFLIPIVNPRSTPFFLLLLLLLGSVAALSLYILPQARMDEGRFKVFSQVVKNQLSPRITLFWKDLIYSDSKIKWTMNTQDLVEQYSIEDYLSQVDEKIDRPNIILIAIEALRSDVIYAKHQGKEITPLFNRLAKEGYFFPNTYSQSGESAYAMSSIMSGLHPLRFPFRDTFSNLSYPYLRLYDLPASVGYTTSFFSSANENWQNMIKFSNSPFLDIFFHSESTPVGHIDSTGDSGFQNTVRDKVLKTGKIDDAETTRNLMEWLKTLNGSKPFLSALSALSYQASHFPYQQGAVPEVFGPSKLSKS